MPVRSLITSVEIGGERFTGQISFSVSHSLNEISKVASLQIQSYLPILSDKLTPNAPCRIFLTNPKGKTEIFNGRILSSSRSGTSYQISALETLIGEEEYHETFQDSQLKDIMKQLGQIKVEGLNNTFRQLIVEGKQSESFIRIIQNLEDLLGMNIYYSIYDDEIVVRETPFLQNKKLFKEVLTHSVSDHRIECFPIPEAQVGDEILLDKKRYLITAISTSNREQSLTIAELRS